ncbi:RNA polymerase sigma factor RpoD, partial [hydrothermal vent metagenome]
MGKPKKDTPNSELVSKGKQRGYLTYDEVNESLPSDVVTSEAIEDFMRTFTDLGIYVMDTAREGARMAAKKAGTGKKGSGKGDDDEGFQPSEDPVRMYLKEMGSISLLTRE